MLSQAFRTAFYSGLAAPVRLYGPLPAYAMYSSPLTPAQSFGLVGVFMQTATAKVLNDGHAERTVA